MRAVQTMRTITEAISCGVKLVKLQTKDRKASVITVNKTLGLIRLAKVLSKKSLDKTQIVC